jgi:hypothetical protein
MMGIDALFSALVFPGAGYPSTLRRQQDIYAANKLVSDTTWIQTAVAYS